MTAILCAGLLMAPGNARLWGQQAPPPPPLPPPGQALAPDQLDGLVAPIALYPDELVSQILVASTYPLELVQAWQWLQRNPGLTGPALTQAAQQQNWDPSIQALVVFPDLVEALEPGHYLDDESGKRFSRSAAGCNGCNPANAAQRGASREIGLDPAAASDQHQRSRTAYRRDPAGRSGDDVPAQL